MKISYDVPDHHLMFVNVPDTSKKYIVVCYGYAGTWLVQETDLKWKFKLPYGRFEVLGATKDVIVDEHQIKENFVLKLVL